MSENTGIAQRFGLFLLTLVMLGGLLSLGLVAGLQRAVASADEGELLLWETDAPLPVGRVYLGAAAVSLDNGAYYAVGGVMTGTQTVNLVHRFDLASGTWMTMTALPQPISQAAVAGESNRLHVIAGLNAAGIPTARHDTYNTSTDSWESRAPYPAARSGVMAASLRSQIYVMGGFNGDGTASKAAWRYDPRADRWYSMDGLLAPTALGGAAALDDHVFVVGGLRNGRPISDFVRYDTRFDVWFQGPPVPEPRVSPVVVAAGGYLYVMGGGGIFGDPSLPWPTAWRYDVSRYPAAAWEPVSTQGLYPLIGAAGTCAGDKVWVVGGVDVDGGVRGLNHYLPLDDVPCSVSRTPVHLPMVEVAEGLENPRNGQWRGTTDHQDPMGFELDWSAGHIVTNTFTGEFYLAFCQQGGPVTVDFTIPRPVPVDTDLWRFQYGDGLLRRIEGEFTSATTAQGTYLLNAVWVPGHQQCAGSGTWQATWQGGK